MKLNRGGGFTLVELAVAIVVGAIVAGSLAKLGPAIALTATASSASSATEQAKAAAMAVASDIAKAYPDSVRTASSGGKIYIESAPMLAVGRYRALDEPSSSLPPCPQDDPQLDPGDASAAPGVGPLSNDRLSIGVPDTCFKTLGAIAPAAAGGWVALPGSGPEGFYSGSARSALAGVEQGDGETMVTMAPASFPADSAGHLFALAGQPSTWVCDPVAGTLSKYSGYAPTQAQPMAFESAPLAQIGGVSSCSATPSGLSWIIAVAAWSGPSAGSDAEEATPQRVAP